MTRKPEPTEGLELLRKFREERRQAEARILQEAAKLPTDAQLRLAVALMRLHASQTAFGDKPAA
jgi:hypothetical protein